MAHTKERFDLRHEVEGFKY